MVRQYTNQSGEILQLSSHGNDITYNNGVTAPLTDDQAAAIAGCDDWIRIPARRNAHRNVKRHYMRQIRPQELREAESADSLIAVMSIYTAQEWSSLKHREHRTDSEKSERITRDNELAFIPGRM